MAKTWEEYRDACMSRGGTEKDARNTWDLMEKIQGVLDSAAFAAPEMQDERKVRIARIFIDQWQDMVKDSDEAIAEWLTVRDAFTLAEAVRRGEHWKWFHSREVK